MARHEGILKAACIKALKEAGFVVMAHEDVRRSGQPDASVTAGGRTTWLEFKHGDPKFDSTGIQELTMLRLAAGGTAYYIVYLEDTDGGGKRTLIVHPRNFKTLAATQGCPGHNHQLVVDFLSQVHSV